MGIDCLDLAFVFPKYAARAIPPLRSKQQEAHLTQGQIEGMGQPAHLYTSSIVVGKVDAFNAGVGARCLSKYQNIVLGSTS